MPTITDKAATLREIERNVRRLARENPDYIYTSPENGQCDYFPTPNNPQGCLIGAAARMAGASLDDGDFTAVEASCALILRLDLTDDDRYANHATLTWLDRVQGWQDEGASWSEAVAYADQEAAEVAALLEEARA